MITKDTIPHELREREQWVVWRWAKQRDGKPTKRPVNPHTGEFASSTDPNTWGSYEEAVAARNMFDYPGIGFVFTADDPYYGIDLDGCRDPETGEIEKWAKKMIKALDSYSEVSPSGSGVHIIGKGTLPPGGRKRGSFECYDSGRFFTVTGEHLDGTPHEIKERSEVLRRLHRRVFGEAEQKSNEHIERRAGNGLPDQEIIARAMRATNEGEFAKLWCGESNGHASASEADLALCSYLGFWTGGDPEAMDRLFRQSGLYRLKWDKRHFADGRTYGQATIEKALDGNSEIYDPKSHSLYEDGNRDAGEDGRKGMDDRPRLRSVRFNEIPAPGPRRYLLGGLIPEGYPTVLHGAGGSAKSMLALSMGLAVARKGQRGSEKVKWLGRDVVEGGEVLYCDFELDATEQRRRVMQLARGERLERVPDTFRYMSALGYSLREAFDATLAECIEYGVRLLILDSLGPALAGDAEAARDVIGFFQRRLEPFRAAGVTVLVIDHQSHLRSGQRYQDKSAFGSVYKTNLARSVIQVEPMSHEEGALTVRLRQKKHNFGPLATPFGAKLKFSEERVTLDAEELDAAHLAEEGTLNAADRIKLALENGPAYPEELAEYTGIPIKTVRNTLSALRGDGDVEGTGEREGEGRSEQVRLIPKS